MMKLPLSEECYANIYELKLLLLRSACCVGENMKWKVRD